MPAQILPKSDRIQIVKGAPGLQIGLDGNENCFSLLTDYSNVSSVVRSCLPSRVGATNSPPETIGTNGSAKNSKLLTNPSRTKRNRYEQVDIVRMMQAMSSLYDLSRLELRLYASIV